MENYFIYGGFIIFLIYIVHKLIKLVLAKVDNNLDSKKELLEYREKYNKKINEFKKLYNEIKNLYDEEEQIGIKYNQLRKHYIGTKNYCNKLADNLDGIGELIAKKYNDMIVPIYKKSEEPLVLEQRYKKYLNPNEVKTEEYYNNLVRNKPGCNPDKKDESGKEIDCSKIPDLPLNPSRTWKSFYIKKY